MDIQLKLAPETFEFDIFLQGSDLATGTDIYTAVIISLFSWARAKAEDDVPKNSPKYGWWGDQISDDTNHRTGSRLWLMKRYKLTQATANIATHFIKEALAWMITDGVISSMEITPEIAKDGKMDVNIRLYRYGEQMINLRYSELWKQIEGDTNGR